MALKPCKSCKHEVDTSAKICPNCGVANPGITIGQQIGGLAILATIIVVVVSMCSGGEKDKPLDRSAAVEQKQESQQISEFDKKSIENVSQTPYSKNLDETFAPYKRTVEVVLASRVTEEELTLIAKKIFAQSKTKTDRTFIGYRLDGQTKGAYWATSHYDPKLKVTILGLTLGDFQNLQAIDVAKVYPNATGAWLRDDGFGCLMVIYERNGKLLLDSIFPSGEKTTSSVVSKKMPGGSVRIAEPENSFGEYYVVDADGGLQGWSENGVYMTLKPLQSKL